MYKRAQSRIIRRTSSNVWWARSDVLKILERSDHLINKPFGGEGEAFPMVLEPLTNGCGYTNGVYLGRVEPTIKSRPSAIQSGF